jgi:hypothetical protein
MNLPNSLFVTALVVAVVQVVKFVRAKDWESIVTVVSAILIGAIAGAFNIEGLTVVNGILAGIGAVGVVTVASKVGGN